MPRRFVDISVALENGIKSDPDFMLPEITYYVHEQTAKEICGLFPGLTPDQLPDSMGWAIEKVKLSTHNGTHVDAPWHYHPTMDGGERAITIDEIPLEWCYQPGVKFDFRHFDDGYLVTPGDMQAELERIGHELQPLNFGLFPILNKGYDWHHQWEPEYLEMTRDFIFRNTFKDIEWVLKTLGEEHGVRFEFECYDMGHLYNLAHFVDRGLIKPPFFVQTIFGILGGIGADLENLDHMRRIANKLFGEENYEWSILAAGRHQMSFVTTGAIMGGNVRVGLEDSLYIGKGQLAESNADQVAKIKRIVEDLSLDVATPAEARERLALKGGDMVKF